MRRHRRNQCIQEAAKKLCAAAGVFAGLMFWGTMGELETGEVIPLKMLAAMLLVEGAAALLSYMAYQTLDALQDWENERYIEERRRRHGRKREIRSGGEDICGREDHHKGAPGAAGGRELPIRDQGLRGLDRRVR